MSHDDSKEDYKVHLITTLGKSEDAQAKKLLHDAAKQVQPIMRRRQWTVPLLTEFFPPAHNLLGLNVGGGGGKTMEVRIRLRHGNSQSSFLHYESILGTMLHELVHNVRGPHDSVFYKLLDEITAECEELMAKGVSGTGVGFDAPSVGRLGSHGPIPAHNPAPSALRTHMVKAAEERAKRQRLTDSGPNRLGGRLLDTRGMMPGQAAAAAAQRRAADDLWCPCQPLAQLQISHAGEPLCVVRVPPGRIG
ncbi:MAG: hypothetical protein WDW36_009991 [Sanguina aurantia]